MKNIIFAIIAALFLLAAALDCHANTQHDDVVATLVLEAANQPYSGKQAVMNVIQNRALAQHKTFYQVVSQTNQFYGFNRRGLARTRNFIAAWRDCDEIVTLAERGQLSDVTNGAMFFDKSGRGLKIGAHFFRKTY